MRLLIAGWHGQIATALAEAAPKCADVTACAIGRPALDICEAKSIERALGDIRPDVVINAAAYTEVDKAESEPERAYALNRDGARLLALAAARRGVPIIHISSDYVFDGRKASPYVETDATAPATVYGCSKLEGEIAVMEANPKHIVLRTAWVYSPVGRNFVRTVLRLAAERGRLSIVDDRRGSPTYAPHLVEGLLALARRLSAGGGAAWGIYHAAGSGTATWCELAREVLSHSAALEGPKAEVAAIGTSDYPTPALRPANSQLDCSKLDRAFGIRLPPWQDGVAECVTRLLQVAANAHD